MTETMAMYWQDQESANDVQPTEDHAHLNVQVIFVFIILLLVIIIISPSPSSSSSSSPSSSLSGNYRRAVPPIHPPTISENNTFNTSPTHGTFATAGGYSCHNHHLLLSTSYLDNPVTRVSNGMAGGADLIYCLG